MSSTNKTTYYELPQFVDNDIFNPLVDDNDAYAKIDTALHNIANAEADDASEIVSIKSRLDSAEGAIDALEAQNGDSVLTTTAQTLSGAVNELDADASALDGRLDIVEDDINNASTGLKAKVTALENQNGNTVLTTEAQTLSGAINELANVNKKQDIIDLVNSISIENGKFIFGDMSTTDAYTNGVCTDGTYFYMALSEYNAVNDAVVIQYNKAGKKLGIVNIGVGHYGNVIYNDVTGYLYVNRQSDILKLDTALNIVETIPYTGGYISVNKGVFYSFYNDVLTEYADEFATVTSTYSMNIAGIPNTRQCAKVFDGLLFICCNYPNSIVVYNIETLKEVARIDISGAIDGVEIGEIQDIDLFKTDDVTSVYLTTAKSLATERFYNPIFILTGLFADYKQKEGLINSNPSVNYYVDSTSPSDYSLGTSEYPFKSMLECFAHCAYSPNAYTIDCINANATIDTPPSTTNAPINRSFNITYRNGVAPSARLRFRNCFAEIHDYITAAHELNIIDSEVTIFTHDGGGDNLTISSTGSSISVNGDVYRVFPSGGIINVSGKLGFVYGTNSPAMVSCKELSHSHSTNHAVTVGNGVRYAKTLQFSVPSNSGGTLEVTSKEILCGILAITNEGGGDGIRVYLVTSYGTGGSARTTINRISDHANDGWFTPAAITDKCGVQVDVSNANVNTINFRATFTMLNSSANSTDDSIEVDMTFTPSA